jgi:serine/threonine-protein kinase
MPPVETSVSIRLRTGRARYEVLDEFAAGGIATVHLARSRTEGGITRVVAVKRLHSHHTRDGEFRAALLDEARLIAPIQHPNVVGMVDVCDEPGDLFIVMEYIHGLPLSKLLGSLPQSPHRVVAILSDVLKGLHAAHEARDKKTGKALDIVHRDVSPQNILVGTDGVSRVIDFGLAYASSRLASTRSGVVKGKPSYMSPEQVRGERVTRASDIFSAGAVLWGALTGKKLFSGDTMEVTVAKVLIDPILPPSSVVPNIWPALDAAVMRALDRDPAKRYATALEMARALEKTCPPDPDENDRIGEWVTQVGGEDLAAMGERVRRVELGVESIPPADLDGPTIPHAQAPAPTQPQTVSEQVSGIKEKSPVPTGMSNAQRALIALGLVLVGGAAVGAAAVLVSRALKAREPSAEPLPTMALPQREIEIIEAPAQTTQSPGAAPSINTSPSASAVIAPASATAAPKSSAPAPRPKKKDCDPLDPRCG